MYHPKWLNKETPRPQQPDAEITGTVAYDPSPIMPSVVGQVRETVEGIMHDSEWAPINAADLLCSIVDHLVDLPIIDEHGLRDAAHTFFPPEGLRSRPYGVLRVPTTEGTCCQLMLAPIHVYDPHGDGPWMCVRCEDGTDVTCYVTD